MPDEARTARLKPGYGTLALLEWLFEKEGRLLAFTDRENWLYEAEPATEAGGKPKLRRAWPSHDRDRDREMLRRLGGSMRQDLTQLQRAGFFVSYSVTGPNAHRAEEFRQAYDGIGSWSYWKTYAVPTQAAREWWNETGARLHAAALAERREREEAVSRLVLIGRPATVGGRFSLKDGALPPGADAFRPRVRTRVPEAIARVTRETASRFYVDDVTPLPGLSGLASGAHAVSGSAPNQFVLRKHVIADGVDEEACRRTAAAFADLREDLDRMADQALEEALPMLRRLADRTGQKLAEHEDAMREALEGKPGRPAP